MSIFFVSRHSRPAVTRVKFCGDRGSNQSKIPAYTGMTLSGLSSSCLTRGSSKEKSTSCFGDRSPERQALLEVIDWIIRSSRIMTNRGIQNVL